MPRKPWNPRWLSSGHPRNCSLFAASPLVTHGRVEPLGHAGFGVTRLKIDDSLSQLFRSGTPEFKQYEEVTRRFPSSEFDVRVVIEGKKLLERESVEKLRHLVTDLQLIDGTRGIISIFSARQPPKNGAIPAPLFADQLPEGAAYDALVGNEIIRGKLLSNDGELTLVVLALDPSVESNRLRDVVGKIRTRVAEAIPNHVAVRTKPPGGRNSKKSA